MHSNNCGTVPMERVFCRPLFETVREQQRFPVFLMRTVLILVLVSLIVSIGNLSNAQVQTLITGDETLNTNVPVGCNICDITGGIRPGNGSNLFHSFGQFDVGTTGVANFLNDSALPTSNILSRVTGGNPSNIFGTIQTQGFGNANLFLINPAGIAFGPDATLNVGGATHFTTADYFRLGDGVQFTALPGVQDGLLSVAPVAAFGFLELIPAPISVDGSTLPVSEGQTISLVGGDVSIGSGLNAPAGQVALVSVASPGEVLANTYASVTNINGQSFTEMGTISFLEGTMVDVSADAAGTVVIRGGHLMMTNATIAANTGNIDGADNAVDIELTGELSIETSESSAISARSTGSGNAGEIRIESQEINVLVPTDLFFSSVINSVTSGTGRGGNLKINTGNLQVRGDPLGFAFFTDSGTAGDGLGGNQIINAGNFILEDIFINTGDNFEFEPFNPTGQAGNVTINGSKLEFLSSGIFSDSFANKGGDITLVGGDLKLDSSLISALGLEQGGKIDIESIGGNFLAIRSTILSTTDLGDGPSPGITLEAKTVVLREGTQLLTSAFGNGDAGPIEVTATDSLSLLGSDSSSNAPSGIFSNSFGDFGTLGKGGDVTITTPTLEIKEGARINTATASSGNGGMVRIESNRVLISDQQTDAPFEEIFGLGTSLGSGIYTSTLGDSMTCGIGCGDAGNINILVRSFILGNGAQLDSGTSGTGKGGRITVSAAEDISIAGTLNDGTPGGVFSRAVGTEPDSRDGGIIALTAGDSFFLRDGATVSASSSGPANAGNIQLTATDTILIDGATVSTEAVQASGGNINLQAQELIRLNDSTISSSVQGNPATVGGNISLDPEFIILENSRVLARAVEGQGGNISLVATNAVLVDPLSVLDASSALGISGSVDIQAPIQNLSGTLAPLPEETTPVTSLYGARCASGQGGQFSTFVDSKSDSLSPPPGRFLASPLLLVSAQPGIDASIVPKPSVVLTASIAPLVLGHSTEPTTACP